MAEKAEDDPHHRPEWVPSQPREGDVYATRVMPGTPQPPSNTGPTPPATPRRRPKRAQPSPQELTAGVLQGNRTLLAQAITLVESNAPRHREAAREVLSSCLPHSGKSLRVGISGVPGAGKSTLIEAFGQARCHEGHKVAVLAVDPSSSRSGGSVLGDKTRMENLTRERNAFIRPSPSGKSLGGVARKTREAMLLCEAAGFDLILVETVGVGQSEVTVRSMVDVFTVLQIAGAGDELQGIKKGIIELADLIVVTKADGDNAARAATTAGSYNRVLHYLQPATPGWQSRAITCSSLTGEGVASIWEHLCDFANTVRASGVHNERRQQQNVEWLHAAIDDALRLRFNAHPEVAKRLSATELAVATGQEPVTVACDRLLAAAGLEA